jgi:cold shock CspA family protein
MRALGTLTKWNADRGFGFVRLRDSRVDVFVHISAFPRSGRQPQIGDALSFEIVTATDGRKQARSVTYDVPLGRADFTLAPIESKPIERQPNERASQPTPVRTSATHPERHRRRESQRTSTGGLRTLIFGALLIGGLVFGYRKFLEYRSVAVDTLYGRSAETNIAPAQHNAPPATPSPNYRCDGRIHCSQMRSCADATQVLQHCPGTQMDGDGDGIPCEQQWCN